MPEALTSLIYELLDTHEDTSRIAASLVLDPTWMTHLDYLRDLQRVGRELLAATEKQDDAATFGCPPPKPQRLR